MGVMVVISGSGLMSIALGVCVCVKKSFWLYPFETSKKSNATGANWADGERERQTFAGFKIALAHQVKGYTIGTGLAVAATPFTFY
jgi:hypothetical protein